MTQAQPSGTTGRHKCPCISAEGKFSLVQAGVTAPQWGQLTILFLLMTGASSCATFHQPFLKEMVMSFGYKETDAGFYVGFVASSFHLGRMISSYFWGYLSDRFGRRPALLTSLLLVSVSTLSFGFSRSFGYASEIGLISGLVNGVVIVGKARIYEISDSSNQSYGIAMLSLSWGLGSLVGPMLGGFLSKFKAVPTFPYLIPSIALSAFAVTVLLVSFFLLREPNRGGIVVDVEEDKLTAAADAAATAASVPLISIEEAAEDNKLTDGERLQRRRRWASTSSGQAGESNKRRQPNGYEDFRSMPNVSKCVSRQRPTVSSRSRSIAMLAAVSAENCLSPAVASQTEASEDLTKPAGTGSAVDLGEAGEKRSLLDRFRASNLGRIMLNCECIQVIAQYFLQSLCAVYLNTLVIVWIPTSTYYGGLGFSAQSLATLLSLSAVSLMVLQPISFPLLERRLGATRLFMHSLTLTLVCSVTLPLVHYTLNTPALVWTLCIVLLCLLNQSFLTSFSCTALLVNNAVPADLVGSMNGISMAWSSLGRLLGPLMSGSIFAASIDSGLDYPLDFNLAFQLTGVLLILCALLGCLQSAKLNSKFEER